MAKKTETPEVPKSEGAKNTYAPLNYAPLNYTQLGTPPVTDTTPVDTSSNDAPTNDSSSNYTTTNDSSSNYGTSNYTTTNDSPSNYGTSNYTTTNDAPSNYGTSNYGQANNVNPYQTLNQQDDLGDGGGYSGLISSSQSESETDGIHTAEMSCTPSELLRFRRTGELDPMVMEVQEKYEGSSDPQVAEMQKSLRAGTKNLYDVPEIIRDPSTKQVTATNTIKREQLTPNESDSKGWALLAMRTDHRARDIGQEKSIYPWEVQYAVSRTMALEKEVTAYIGKHMAAKREDYLVTLKGGKLVDANEQAVDTMKAEVGGQAQRQRLEKLIERLEAATKEGLGDKVEALEKKIHIAHKKPAKDKHIAGKFIYVMNAAGQFFATKPEQFKIHHSTMLASGAVACAGEIQVAGGVIRSISNMSGHYRPGPVYLWQAVKQLQMMGAPMDFSVDVVGVTRKFKTATEFLGAMDPVADPRLFDGGYAAEWLKAGY